MRTEKWALTAVSTLLIPACASSIWYESGSVSDPSYESGEVVRVRFVTYREGDDLIGLAERYPNTINNDRCGDDGDGCRIQRNFTRRLYSTREVWYDAVRLRGSDETLDVRAPDEIHVTVRLDHGEQIIVVSPNDLGLLPGEPVQVGFQTPATPAELARVTLSRP